MATISGIVTDTGTTPIAGATVRLEKGGQTATTGADGSFTLVVESSGTLPRNRNLLPHGLTAQLSGAMLSVTTTKQTSVEIALFDLGGKLHSTMTQPLSAGSHGITLPLTGEGIYLCTVTSGTGTLVLKGNSVRGVSSGKSALSQNSTSYHVAKQTGATAAFNDVITATKTGLLPYRSFIGNADTSGIVISMIANEGTVSDTDGNVYPTVRIGTQVWTTGNLRVTKYNDGTEIPSILNKAPWDSCTYSETAAYCFYNNTANADSSTTYGALYNWYVVQPANPKKIAPAGWHVPTDAEWDTLQNNLIAMGYNWDFTTTGNKIAQSLSAKTDWYTASGAGSPGCNLTNNNSTGFSALPGGYRDYDGAFMSIGSLGAWWSATDKGGSFAFGRRLFCDSDYLFRLSYIKSCGFSVLLVRD